MIQTERLILLEPVVADFDDSLSMNRHAVMAQYTGGTVLTPEEVWRKLLQRIGHWSAFGYGVFTVRRKIDDAFVGEVGLAHFRRGFGDAFDASPEAAWMTSPSMHGNGFATEAVGAALSWMAARHRMTRSVCIIHPDNQPSLRVAANLGFEPIGEVAYRDARPVMFERKTA